MYPGGMITLMTGFFVLVVSLTWSNQDKNTLSYKKVFAPKYEQTLCNTIELYNEGIIQELQNMQFQYVNSEQKDALASIILHRTADSDMHKLPSDLRQFVQYLRQEKRVADRRKMIKQLYRFILVD